MIVRNMVGDQTYALIEQYIVETTSDLADILTDAAGPRKITKKLPFGSVAFVLNDRDFYMIGFDANENKQWVKISSL